MLTELQIRNFLIIESLDLSFSPGMTVVTGETGAGKSMLLDALQFALGGRGDIKLLRTGARDAQITVQVGDEVLRRVLNADGRSKASINGDLVSVQELKQYGAAKINWVGQYEHQALLKPEAQLAALDAFAEVGMLLAEVKNLAAAVHHLTAQLQVLQAQKETEQTELQFKLYQQEILTELDLQVNEWDRLHEEQKKLAGAGALLQKLASLLSLLHEDEINLNRQVQGINKEVQNLAVDFESLQSAADLCESANVNLQEAYSELKSFYDSLDLNEERLAEVEARLSEIHDVARKLHVAPEGLGELQDSLAASLSGQNALDAEIAEQMKALEAAKARYLVVAKDLQAQRRSAASQMAEHVSREIKTLGMREAEFRVDFTIPEGAGVTQFPVTGLDRVDFAVSINLGQAWGSLKQTASGGELSRIALVIAVLNAKVMDAKTLIFDEVDVGVSGAVAEKVGQLLKALSKTVQVICITHLPQVAMAGNQHIHVSKEFRDGATFGSAKFLNHEERVEELARILSGEQITDHARELARSGLQS